MTSHIPIRRDFMASPFAASWHPTSLPLPETLTVPDLVVLGGHRNGNAVGHRDGRRKRFAGSRGVSESQAAMSFQRNFLLRVVAMSGASMAMAFCLLSWVGTSGARPRETSRPLTIRPSWRKAIAKNGHDSGGRSRV
jgi:hypothetical protein